MQNTHTHCTCGSCDDAQARVEAPYALHANPPRSDDGPALARARRLFDAELQRLVEVARVLRVERDALQAQVNASWAARSRLAEVERERDGARADLYETREDLRRRREERDDARAALDEARAVRANQEATIDSLREALASAIDELVTARAEAARLRVENPDAAFQAFELVRAARDEALRALDEERAKSAVQWQNLEAVRARLREVELERDGARADERDEARTAVNEIRALRERLADAEKAARVQLAEVECERDGARADLYETQEDLRRRREERDEARTAYEEAVNEIRALRERLAGARETRDEAAEVLRHELRLRTAAELDRDRYLATLGKLARAYMKCVVCLRSTGEIRHATIWANAGGPQGFPVCSVCFDGQGTPAQQPASSSRNVERPPRPARVGDVIVNIHTGTAERIVRIDMGPRDAIDAYTMPPDYEGDPLAGTPDEVKERLGPPIRGDSWWRAWKHADGAAISGVDLHPAPSSG